MQGWHSHHDWQRIRGHVAGQGLRKPTEEECAPEARRAREQKQARVGMPIPENRFAAILRWTLFRRSLAWRKYASSISTPMYLRPRLHMSFLTGK